MKYLLTIYTDESSYASISPEQSSAMLEAYGAFGREAQEAGALLGGEGLQPTATATTVRVRDGEALFTDGPFAETREQLGGYYLIDAENLDEAIAIAARIPMAQRGTIEIRPIVELSGLPEKSSS
jgi:hypothetical protein